MIRYFCDKCDQEIKTTKSHRVFLTEPYERGTRYDPRTDWSPERGPKKLDAEVCEDCAEALTRWWNIRRK